MNLYAPMMNLLFAAFLKVCHLFFTILFLLFLNASVLSSWLYISAHIKIYYPTWVFFCNTNTTKSFWLCFPNIIPLNSYHVFSYISKFFLQVITETKKAPCYQHKSLLVCFLFVPLHLPYLFLDSFLKYFMN